ncbi:MAG: fibronectin type III domain-containing protein [Phycisphaerales bacterium]|nr:fibronectin type III domain-containing protein [Phycisphaerales bacterium]
MQNLFRKTAAMLAALVTLPAMALAGGAELGFNVDIDRPNIIDDNPPASYGAAAAQAGYWNPVIADSAATFQLRDLNGVLTSATVRRTVGNGNHQYQCPGGFIDINWSKLMCDYAWDVTGVVNPIEYQFENLPGGAYDLYTYACQPGDTFQPGFNIGVWVDNVYQGTTFITGTVLSSTFTEGTTHDIRTVNVPNGSTLRVRAWDGNGEFGDEVSLNGFQLVRVDDPKAEITAPDLLGCACNPVSITGSASGAGFSGYWVEYSQNGNDPWTLISQSNVPVTNSTLATWNTTGLAEGYYTIRVTVANTAGQTSTAFTVVWINNTFNPIGIDSPVPGGIYGGRVCFDGTIWDNCFSRYFVDYSPDGGVNWTPVDPANPFYTTPVINELAAIWDTIAAAVPDGAYWVRVRGVPICGDIVEERFQIVIDNTPPYAEITTPDPCTMHCGLVEVFGRAFDENIAGWVLQYTGGPINGWVNIASGNTNVAGLLGIWDTTDLPACCYTLRLVVTDQAQVNCTGLPHQSEYLVSVGVGIEGDLDGDGIVDLDDLQLMLFNFGMTCPPAP